MAKINKEQILKRVSQKLNNNIFGKSKNNFYGTNNVNLEYIESFGKQENDSIYVFKNNNQIIFSPADDELKPIIGYFNDFSGKFKFNNLPEHIKVFLNSYAIDIENFQNSTPIENENKQFGKSNEKTETIYGATTYDNIIPTIDEVKQTWQDVNLTNCDYKWNQGNPYYKEGNYVKNPSTHENYADNKFMWYRDAQNEYVDSNPNVITNTVDMVEKKSDGSSSFSFTYNSNANLNFNQFCVYVDKTEWTKVTTFGTTTSKNEYKISQNSSYTITVLFGDGITSNIPPNGKYVYLKYKQTRKEYYGYSTTANQYIKTHAGCATLAISMIISYWGTYGVKIYKNGQEQIKTYRVGSKSIPKQTIIPSKKRSINNKSRWFILEHTALPAVTEFDYNNIVKDTSVQWYNTKTKTFNFEVDNNHVDIVNGTTITEAKKNQRTAVGTLVRYVNQGLKSENSPNGTGAHLTYAFYTLRNYLPFGKNAYVNGSNQIHITLSQFYGNTSVKSPFLHGVNMDTSNTLTSNYVVTSQSYLDAFEIALYRELSRGIPVPFAVWGKYVGTGTARDSAHGIVCCGYKKDTNNIDDLWKFNFGWGGKSNDSWFTLRISTAYPDQLSPGDYRYNTSRQLLYRFYPNEYYNDFIEVTKENITFENTGGTDTIMVCSMEYDANTNTSVKSSSTTWNYNTAGIPSWLTVEKDTTSGVKLFIKANPNSGTQKTHSIRVFKTKDNTVYTNVNITLKGSGEQIIYTLDIEESSVIFDYTGYNTQDYSISVSSNIGWEIYTYDQTINWLTKCQKNNNNLIIRVAENNTQVIRQTTITLRTTDPEHSVTKTINITVGAAAANYLNIDETNVIIDKNGGTFYVQVNTNLDWTITYTKPEWLTATKDSNLNRISLVSLPSNYGSVQYCTITIKPVNTSFDALSKTLQVSLENNVYLNLSKSILIFNNHTEEEIKTITVTSNVEWIFTNIISDWLTITKNNNVLTLTAQPNLDLIDKTVSIKINTIDETEEEYLTVTILAYISEQNENILKLSTNKIIFNQTYKQGIIQVSSNNIWFIDEYIFNNVYSSNLYGAGNNNWLNIQIQQTSDSTKNNLVITSNYNDDGETNCLVILKSNTGLQQELQIKAIGNITNQDSQDDDIGQDDGNGNIIINRNGQNLKISIYGKKGTDIIKDSILLKLYYDAGTGYNNISSEMIYEGENIIYMLNIGENYELTNKIYKLYGTYQYFNNQNIESKVLSFIQKAQHFTIYINVNKDIFSYNDTDPLIITYWVETSNGTHIYDINDVQLTILNPATEFNPINYQTIQGPTEDNISKTLSKTLSNISNNTDNIERRLILQVSYKTLSDTLIIKQLSEYQIMLKSFDFFTLEYNIQNNYNDYISVRNFINMNQLNNINSYAGEEIHTIMVLSANDDLPINKTINNIVVDLSNLKIGFQQDIAQNNNIYSNYFRYSGKNLNELEKESIFINLFNIIQNLYEGINEIKCEFYAHWANTRSTGKLKTKITTYKNQPSNITLNNYIYSFNNTKVDIKENINYVYDITNDTTNILNYTKVLQLVYNIKLKTGVIYHINESHNAAKNIYVFSPGYNLPLITNYINNTYITNITVQPSTTSSLVFTKIYIYNMIYQIFDVVTTQLNPYQVLTETIGFVDNGGVISEISTDNNGKYIQIQSPENLGTYNIILSLTPSNTHITLQVIVSNLNTLRGDMIIDPQF